MIPAAGSRPGESLPEQWKECKSTARAANRMEESGRSDAPRYSDMGLRSHLYLSVGKTERLKYQAVL